MMKSGQFTHLRPIMSDMSDYILPNVGDLIVLKTRNHMFKIAMVGYCTKRYTNLFNNPECHIKWSYVNDKAHESTFTQRKRYTEVGFQQLFDYYDVYKKAMRTEQTFSIAKEKEV